MKVLIIGAGGMIGRKLTARIKGQHDLTLVDVVAGSGIKEADLSVPGTAEALVKDKPDTIVHLAAIVSGEAEADFERGLSHQSRRHALPVRSDPAGRRKAILSAAPRLHLIHRGFRCALPGEDRR